MITIPFNKPFLTGNETKYIEQAVKSGKISGNGIFTQKCQQYFEHTYGFGKCLITSSCTDALEMAAILCRIGCGDEVIVPSYTFVSTALAFAREGAKIVFADSSAQDPNISPESIERLITTKTKALVIVHYGGMACQMDKIMEIASRHRLILIEDCAHAFDSRYGQKPLGTFGQMAAFSFHETKNIISGEGGMLAINNPELYRRAEIIWEKGTNRAEFQRGAASKYQWIDTGSSFLPSEITTAFLWAQIESSAIIQQKRIAIWMQYFRTLNAPLGNIGVSTSKAGMQQTCNGHLFYIICRSGHERDSLSQCLLEHGILAVSHYLALHKSPYQTAQTQGQNQQSLPWANAYEKKLLRLPLYCGLEATQVDDICRIILNFYNLE